MTHARTTISDPRPLNRDATVRERASGNGSNGKPTHSAQRPGRPPSTKTAGARFPSRTLPRGNPFPLFKTKTPPKQTPALLRACAIIITLILTPITNAQSDLELLRQYQLLFRNAAERVAPSIVQVETIGGAQPRSAITDQIEQPDLEEDGTPEEPAFVDTVGSDFLVADGPTTGIIYDPAGLIITSSFNFVREPAVVTVRLADGRRFPAKVLGRDRVRKLAMLKIEADNLPVPQWVPREELQVGQTVIALGVALPGDQPTLTVGIISALNRMLGNAVQTDAKLSPANYGGPLIDLKGRVVGLCVPMAQRPGELAGVKLYDSGVGFAVPYDRITEIGEQLRAGQSFWRGWLGVQFNPRYTGGLFIRAIANPSPIYAAGVRPGDIITWVNGRTVKSGENLVKAIYMLPAGEPIQMCITRNDRSMGLTTTLARAKDLGQLEQLQPKLPDRTPWQRRPLAPWRR